MHAGNLMQSYSILQLVLLWVNYWTFHVREDYIIEIQILNASVFLPSKATIFVLWVSQGVFVNLVSLHVQKNCRGQHLKATDPFPHDAADLQVLTAGSAKRVKKDGSSTPTGCNPFLSEVTAALAGIPDVAAISTPLNRSVNTHKVWVLSAWLDDGDTTAGFLPGLTD